MNPDDKREVRADARDVRADARDVRSDVVDTGLRGRTARADVREDVISDREQTIIGGIRLLKWFAIVLIVLSLGGLLRSYINQNAAEKSTNAAERVELATLRVEAITEETRDASVESLRELRIIVARIEANANEPEVQNQAVIEALQTIARIEAFICGGPCPEAE